MNTTFNFSIRTAVRQAWEIFKKHAVFFIVLTAPIVLVDWVSNKTQLQGIIAFVLMVVMYVWSVTWTKVSLNATKSNTYPLSFQSLRSFLPTSIQVVQIFKIDFLSKIIGAIGIAVLGATVLFAVFSGSLSVGFLIVGIVFFVPGVYIALRFSMARYFFLDQGLTVRKALRASWDVTGGKIGILVLTILTVGLLYAIGSIGYGIGLLITYALIELIMAKLYVAFVNTESHTEAIVVQPAEIPQDLPDIETV